MIRLGIVDFDTSHAVEFTKRLNHVAIDEEQWVEGAQVVAGYPGTSKITDQELIDKYTRTLSDDFGVELVDEPSDLIGKVDGVLIESQGGDPHLAHARTFLEAGVPVYVDKPFACKVQDAKEMIELADSKGLPIFSASSLRFGMEVVDLLSRQDEVGKVVGADAYSPASLHDGNPGFFHYGIHGVETLFALMGKGCQSVICRSTDGADLATGIWEGDRIGTMRGTRAGGHLYGFTAFCEKKVVQSSINASFIYRELLKKVVEMFQTGKSPIDPQETLEIISFIVAAKESADRGGEKVEL